MIKDAEYEKAWTEDPTPLKDAVKAAVKAEPHPDEYVQAHRDMEVADESDDEPKLDANGDPIDPDEDADGEGADEREQRLADEAAKGAKA